MKFTFKKYIVELLIYDLFINIFVVVLECLIFQKSIITILPLTILLIIDINFFKEFHRLKKFIRETPKEKLKKLEYDLSNNYLIYDYWYLTDEYMFSLKELIKIKYKDIIVVEGGIALVSGYNNIGYKETIYLKNGRTYKLKSSLSSSNPSLFKEIITKKNSSTYFGIIEDYMKIKNKSKERSN